MGRLDFVAALRDAERRLAAQGMPPEVDRRLRARLAGRREPPPWRAPALGALLGAATALVWWLVWGRATPELAGFEIIAGAADVRARGGVLEIDGGGATLRSAGDGVTVVTRGATRLHKEPGGLRVVAGVVNVVVARRRSGAPPLRVSVSGGAIDVLGTRFRVTQRPDGGRVELEEGSIVFVALDGRRRRLRPGQSLAWPLAPDDPPVPARLVPRPSPAAVPAVAPPPAPSRPVPATGGRPAARPAPVSRPAARPAPAPPPPPAGAAALFGELRELRARGRFAEAAQRIEEALDTPGLRAATRELLGMERLSILEHQLADPPGACAAARRQLAQFPDGAMAGDARAAIARLRCGAGTP
jgi:transmembrane sensor